MPAQFLELIDTGVDYFTSTCSDPKRAKILHDKAAILIMQEHAAGNEKKLWRSYGYEGFHCGGVDVGTRHDGTIVRLSGPTAYHHWKKFFSLATNVSRLDVQATVRWSEKSHTVLSKHFRASKRAFKLGHIKRKVTILKSMDDSATIYYGVRESERFGRIYQKDLESKLDHYQNALRYELELKGDLAYRTAKALDTRSSQQGLCYNTVRQYYIDAGVRLPSFPDNQLALISASRTRSDRTSRLAWLSQSVKPALESLLTCSDLPTIIDALGLTDYVVVHPKMDQQNFCQQEETIQ